ncbi:MAG: GFA family protein [Akkermansiaceae bacterium]
MSISIHGGCLCGATRYETIGEPLQTTACHCEDCRRASGAPFVVWSFFKTGHITWTKAAPKIITFADRDRAFCGNCGTPLTFFDPAYPEIFEINTSTFDDPSPYPPLDQCWMDDKIDWSHSIPDLPQSSETGPLPEF